MQLSVACNLIPKGVRMRTGRWIISHRCGWNGLCILCNARIFIHSAYSLDHRTRALSVNCPSVIRLPSIGYLYGETTLVNCGSRSFFLNITAILYCESLFTFCNLLFCKQFFIHTIHLTLCVQQNQWAWQPRWLVGAKWFGCLCADSKLLLTPVATAWPTISWFATPSEETPFSYWSINLGIVYRGKLAAVLIIPSSWGSPTRSA